MRSALLAVFLPILPDAYFLVYSPEGVRQQYLDKRDLHSTHGSSPASVNGFFFLAR